MADLSSYRFSDLIDHDDEETRVTPAAVLWSLENPRNLSPTTVGYFQSLAAAVENVDFLH